MAANIAVVQIAVRNVWLKCDNVCLFFFLSLDFWHLNNSSNSEHVGVTGPLFKTVVQLYDSPGYGRFKHLTHPWHQNCVVYLQALRTFNYYDELRTKLHSDLTL